MPRNKPQVGSVPKNVTGYITNKRSFPKPTHYQTAGVRKAAFDAGVAKTQTQRPSFPNNSRRGTTKNSHDNL